MTGMSEQPRPPKQEQELASTEVTEVADGVLRMQLPINLPGLGHVNCYALEDEHGVALVDPGLASDDSWDALVQRLGQAGIEPRHVHTAVVTHSHHDHFGGVHRLREATDCRLLTHSAFRSVFAASEAAENPDAESLEDASDDDVDRFRARWRRRTPWGTERTPPPEAEMRRFMRDGHSAMFLTPEPDIRVDDAEVVTLAGREWLAVYTPGHTNDHLCLYDPTEKIMLSGDHVLPSITPHIGGLTDRSDPLKAFFESLQRMHEFDTNLVLPAHGHPFSDLKGRADDIIVHHEERLDIIRDASDDLGLASVNDYMRRLFRERSWGDMAESETYAHLEHLRLIGEAEVRADDGGLLHYAIS